MPKDNMWEKIVVAFGNIEELVAQVAKERETAKPEEQAKLIAIEFAANEAFDSLVQLRLEFKKSM
jgi:hypothetical protein